MDVQIKTSGGIRLVPIETKLMDERKIFLEGAVCYESVLQIFKQMSILNAASHEPVLLFISSKGGEAESALALCEAISSSKSPVHTVCIGEACSAAALVFASGKRRIMTPYSRLMVHLPFMQTTGPMSGTSETIRSMAEHIDELSTSVIEVLSIAAGKEPEEVRKAISYDHYFNPEEAVNFRLADEIVSMGDLMS